MEADEFLVKEGAFVNDYYTQKAREIAKFMREKLGLSFDNAEFRLVNNDDMAESMATYGDPLPTWATGQNYIISRTEMMDLHYSLYEMVGHYTYDSFSNGRKFIVYINKSDREHEILGVIAHVYGHLHMDKNNFVCADNLSDLSKHSALRRRYRKLEELVGSKEVERVFDLGQTLAGLIDLYPTSRTEKKQEYYSTDKDSPGHDEYDVFDFVLKNVTMLPWEREVLEMVKDIYSTYRTVRVKIMHEGFASFVQEKYAEEVSKTDIDTGLKMHELLYAIANPLNDSQMPYAFGLRLFKDIEKRWNEGKHGLVYSQLPRQDRLEYKTDEKRGMEKVLDITRSCSDWDFIFKYCDEDFMDKYTKETLDMLEVELRREAVERDEKYEKSWWYKWIMRYTRERTDPEELKLELLTRTESYSPTVYIPKGGFNNQEGLTLKQDLSVLDRYVNSTDPDKREEELAEVKARFAEQLTVTNGFTYAALSRVSNFIKLPVRLQTIDEEGNDITIVADGEDVYAE